MEGYKPQDFSFFHRSEKLVQRFHHITREQAMFLLSNAVQSEIYIYDNDKDDQRAGGGI